MNLKKYTLDQLKDAILSSKSIIECLQKLNVKAAGGNYDIFRKAVKHFDLDISHFNYREEGAKKIRGKPSKNKRPLNEVLTINSDYQSNKLRKRLIKECNFEHKCSCCGLDSWFNQPIPLELDHINGNNKDNRIENLRLLCPNCHSLTPTYRGRNIRNKLVGATGIEPA